MSSACMDTAFGGDCNEAWTSAEAVSGTDLCDSRSCDHTQYDPSGKVLVVSAWLSFDRPWRISHALLNTYLPDPLHRLE